MLQFKIKPLFDVLLKIILVTIIIIAFLLLLLFLATKNDWVVYETNNVEDYGVVTGNYDNKSPKNFVDSFFPKCIEPIFSDVNYHYKAITGDTYAYEMWLEFVIEDKVQYEEYLSTLGNGKIPLTFAYDKSYNVYVIEETFDINQSSNSNKYSIEYAKLGKILFSKDEQRIIFIAMGVFDGGGTTTEDLNYYWSRFNIEPYSNVD